MSYKRMVKRNIPKNSDVCRGCKNRLKIRYTEKESRDEYFENKNTQDYYYICNYLKIKSCNYDKDKFSTLYYEYMAGDLTAKEYNEYMEKENEMYFKGLFHSGYKICGEYEAKRVKISEWECRWYSLIDNTKLFFTPNDNYCLDDIPF